MMADLDRAAVELARMAGVEPTAAISGLRDDTLAILNPEHEMSELDNPARAAVLAGLKKASLIDRYQARKDALELAIKCARDREIQIAPSTTLLPTSTDGIIETAQKFYDFILDIAGPEQVAFGETLVDE